MTRIAVIGGGIAGLTLATRLKQRAHVTVFEKARGVGGRMSTRRAEPFEFDHGAQYFTARSQEFQSFLQPLMANGSVSEWRPRYGVFDRNTLIRSDWPRAEPRYVAVPGMNSLCKHLAVSCDIRLNTRIATVTSSPEGHRWHASDDCGNQVGVFDWVVSTAPSPQTLALLPETFAHYKAIQEINMQACFTLMLGFTRPLAWTFEAAHVKNSDVSWLARNCHKPGRSGSDTLVVQSSSQFAQTYIDADPLDVAARLCAQASEIVRTDLSAAAYQTVHAWRYASNQISEPLAQEGFLDREMRLGACGDWCQGGRVEGAFLSAIQLAQNIQNEA